MAKNSGEKRLFADAYDASVQAANITWPNPNPREHDSALYLARLRLDSLLHQRVVIPDGVFLDGPFFLSAAKSIRQLPLERMEIKARARTLNEVLIGYVRRPNIDMLVDTFFTSMPPDQAIIAQQELPKFRASEVSDWKDIIRIFRLIKLESDLVDSFEEAWGNWISFEASGRLNISPWTDFNFIERLDSRVSSKYAQLKFCLKNFGTEFGYDIAERVFERRRSRNSVAGILTEATEHDLTDRELADIATIRFWHDEAYNLTIAEHHKCNTTEVTVLDSVRPFAIDIMFVQRESTDLIPLDETLGIPENFVASLGSIDVSKFNSMISDRKTAQHLEEWYQGTSFLNLRDALERIVKQVDEEKNIPFHSPVISSIISNIKYFISDESANAASKYISEIGGMTDVKLYEKMIAGIISLSGKPIVHVLDPVASELKQRRIVKSIIRTAKKREKNI